MKEKIRFKKIAKMTVTDNLFLQLRSSQRYRNYSYGHQLYPSVVVGGSFNIDIDFSKVYLMSDIKKKPVI
jgi:hypothetical protein